MQNVLAMVLAGGKGERLSPLTAKRPKPCVPFGGKYKIIDFALSNLFNSGIRRIYVLSQYQAFSMHKHLRNSWMNWTGLGEFVTPLSPETTSENEDWFKGTADAIFQYSRFIEFSDAEYVVVFSGDHIYKMDVRQMVQEHISTGADLTIAALEVTSDEAKRFGIMSVDETSRVVEFTEKPEEPKRIPGKNSCYASMGNYVFSAKALLSILKSGNDLHENLDFGKHIIPMMLQSQSKVFAYNFMSNQVPDMTESEVGYWKDVGTIDSYYEANMDLIHVTPQLNLYNYSWPILTHQSNLPPSKTVFDGDDRRGHAVDSYVSDGCIISGGLARRSILGPKCYLHSYCQVEDSILFEGVVVHRGAKLRRVIVDKNVIILAGEEIGFNHDADRAKGYTVSDSGVVVVSKQ